MSSRQVCKFFSSPRGCRFGGNCRFRHEQVPESTPTSPDNSSNANGSKKPNKDAPLGVCRNYWKTGECQNGFQCRFKHVESPDRTKRHTEASSSQVRAQKANVATDSGMMELSAGNTDALFAMDEKACTPGETHNYLKKYLQDSFRFLNNPGSVASFLRLINYSMAPSWVNKFAPLLKLFVSSWSTGNGLLRLADVIRWSKVSATAGADRSALSFQNHYLLLLRFLSSDIVVKNGRSNLVNATYMTVLENLEQFTSIIENCMGAIMKARTFWDPYQSRASVGSESSPGSCSQVISTLSKILFECLTRFKNAIVTYPQLLRLVQLVQEWLLIWKDAIMSQDQTKQFDDPLREYPPAKLKFIISYLEDQVDKIVKIASREESKLEALNKPPTAVINPTPVVRHNEGLIATLNMIYEPVGGRHDNDLADINDMRIAPTSGELLSESSFTPANIYGAPHHLPVGTMERLLDIQFRLLREELIAPLRSSVQLVRNDLLVGYRRKTRLHDILQKQGGKYRGASDKNSDSVIFNVYTNVTFGNMIPDWRGLATLLSIDTPPGRARAASRAARVGYWDTAGGKRLMQGSLVALLWEERNEVQVYLGTMTSSTKDIKDSAAESQSRLALKVVFFDETVQVRILNSLKRPESDSRKVLIEAPVMFEAIRPFLEALRREPESVPFGRYLIHQPPGTLSSQPISPPRYTLTPEFTFQLASLFPAEQRVTNLKLSTSDPESIGIARTELRNRSRLDPSQADAVVDALTKELSLIQGPPGTGKSFTGVEIIRILLQKAKPILLIAFTNHALDHLLCSILDNGITRNIVRLGSRSSDERIKDFSIETLEMAQGRTVLDGTTNRLYRELKDTQIQIKKLMEKILRKKIPTGAVMRHLQNDPEYLDHSDSFSFPPDWVVSAVQAQAAELEDGWEKVKGKQSAARDDDDDDENTILKFWAEEQDLDHLDAWIHLQEQKAAADLNDSNLSDSAVTQAGNRYDILAQQDADDASGDEQSDDSSDDAGSDVGDVIEEEWEKATWPEEGSVQTQLSSPLDSDPGAYVDFPPPSASPTRSAPGPSNPQAQIQLPEVPRSNRRLEELLLCGDVWNMSRSERRRLYSHWEYETREMLKISQQSDFNRLREAHEEQLRAYQECKEQVRRNLLQRAEIVGCTTTGAAKLSSLMKSLSPQVMVVEEAGQVLEAHILGSLVPSIQHMILIGDPLQLRPTLNNYALSIDNKRGKVLYKFDMSLMERLSSSGLPMSLINVQRRMRPDISDLVRNTLYPRLVDHDIVRNYKHVRGLAKDVFFMTHTHPENDGSEDISSKYNTFEADMIKEFVLYLVRQGYSNDGDIVVLVGYLGQLVRVREALAEMVTVVIDERDQKELDDRANDESSDADEPSQPLVQRNKLSRYVRIRTIDNYQGEEAKVVILSTVRNVGTGEDQLEQRRSNIGFLKSENRINVALSRAKEGLYIMGNATQLAAKSQMWSEVIDMLTEREALGPAFPIVCSQHSETVQWVSNPEQIRRFAPDGGCLENCDYSLECGHTCPYKCHPDDPNHLRVKCSQNCRRLCSRGHPCKKLCHEECGNCTFPFHNVVLPCPYQHQVLSICSYSMDRLDELHCHALVPKSLPNCEHIAELECSEDPIQYNCNKPCNGIMSCCGRTCNSTCWECQTRIPQLQDESGKIHRVNHVPHSCEKRLYCAHQCVELCSEGHRCTTFCKNPCRQVCPHTKCRKYCSTPCPPCQEPCTWNCEHESCPAPCGSVCIRLPCDKRCKRQLKCGHRCPSVCGEDCSIQICPTCAPADLQDSVVDLILYLTLSDVCVEEETLDNLLITLPACGHVFTVETLDGICGMKDYYTSRDQDGRQIWSGLKSPDSSEIAVPPACPTCRSAITCPRYGRIYKRANLDILERNVISNMTQRLDGIQTDFNNLSRPTIEAILATHAEKAVFDSNPADEKKKREMTRKRALILKDQMDQPVAIVNLVPSNKKLFHIPNDVSTKWNLALARLTNIYTRAVETAKIRGPHIAAWEGSFSCLFEQEMAVYQSNYSRLPDHPEENAMRVAKLRVGQPQPQADRRFLVEAIWITLQIRFLMVSLANSFRNAALNRGEQNPFLEQRQWASYTKFILDSCVMDAEKAVTIAQSSGARRQVTSSKLLCMRANLELFRFNVDMTHAVGGLRNIESRQKLVDQATTEAQSLKEEIISVNREHLQKLPNDRSEWMKNNFNDAAILILDEWKAIASSLRNETFYEPVSLDEKISIVRAFDFGHVGHFYTCRNGHVFVIGECGGAMQSSTCPECGERIGGSNHQLDNSNGRADEFEQIARNQGSQRSPWAWGN
ncbi:P-loop containing nucleoside triphosphate hydrolase protein [Dendrothele bispora CBS 962.96]|uniref:P-loop containing nucleoside triphosphate hydrolase protein n=1 Tax=Dendrothele bispora (strain CBS 962.96) TaxID=1314807 RepID=A0A4V4HG86_DENBC|nr:P-loop containing nucleoside triphosphate hydrolase protein [Dendrothele bispora CBS 962.96]